MSESGRQYFADCRSLPGLLASSERQTRTLPPDDGLLVDDFVIGKSNGDESVSLEMEDLVDVKENEEEEEDWNDTRWAVPQSDPLSSRMPSDVGKSQISEVEEKKEEKEGKDEIQKQNALMSRMEINDHKAGMQGLDREKVNQIIFEASKGSKYFENERKKEEQVNKRVEEQQRKLDKLNNVQIQQGLVEIDKLLIELEESRDLSRSIVHVDMDAYYAAVEERDDPSLKDKPMAVGGSSMLSTSNYHARKYGVRAGMPGFIGKKLCPDLILVQPNFAQYTSVSHEIREVMSAYDPNFCPMSLDEAYLDFTRHILARKESSSSDRTFYYRPDDSLCCCIVENLDFDFEEQFKVAREEVDQVTLHKSTTDENKDVITESENSATLSQSESESGVDSEVRICTLCGKQLPDIKSLRAKEFGISLEESVNEMRFRIHQKTKLTASAGIAANTMLAKVGSDRNKPNGQFMVPFTLEAVKDFVRDLPIRKVSGIGKVSEKMLSVLGIKTCSDLLAKRGILFHLYSAISFNYFMRIALGIGSTKVVGEASHKRKSYSTERTFGEMSKPAELFKKCLELCESLCEGLKSENIKGRTVTLKIKTVKFEVKTKAQSLMTLTNDFEAIYSSARDLLRTEIQAVAPQPLKLRLMGVRLSNLVDMDEEENHKQGTITDIFKKMQSSPQKVKKTVPSEPYSGAASLAECSSLQQISVPESQCEKTPVKELNTTDIARVSETSKSDVLIDTTPSRSRDLTVDVGKSQKEAGPSTGRLATKSIADMFKAIPSTCAINDNKLSHNDAEESEPQVMKSEDETNDQPVSERHNSGIEDKPEGSEINVDNVGAAEDEESYECPICGKVLEGYSTNKISLHVDKCLTSNEENNNGTSTRDADTHSSAASVSKTPKPFLSQDSFKTANRDSVANTPKSSANSAKKKSRTPKRPATEKFVPSSSDSLLICPVCDLEQDTFDLVAFNKHVDSCLSKATIRQIVKQQDKEPPNKRGNSSGQHKDTPPKKKIKLGTIDSFFKR